MTGHCASPLDIQGCGCSTYYWDSAARQVQFLYFENMGGISRGTVQSSAGALVSPPTQYVADGQSMTYRVRWSLLGNDAYEAWSEAQGPKGWSTMFKVTLKKE